MGDKEKSAKSMPQEPVIVLTRGMSTDTVRRLHRELVDERSKSGTGESQELAASTRGK
jgi:hypothetical protein